nr:RNA-directed DNA polymerase, eukaryota, nucleotide-binding alpha-beta plait domain protein [Tanacetum cinerariifolium]
MAGARFGFVRFIRVRDVVNLISNLRTVWMGSYHLYADVARKEREQFKRMGQPIPTKVNTYSGVPQKNRMVAKSFFAAVQQGSHDSWSRNQVYVQKKYDNCVEKQATEGIRVKVNRKYYDVLINEFAYWAPDFVFEDDCESNESSESDCSDGKKSDTSSGPTVFEECYTEKPVHKSGQEKSDSDPFNLMGLIEKQGINLVKKDKETLINRDADKETDQPITTEFNKDQGNECQDGSCNDQSIYNSNVRNKNTHTNITEIKEAMAKNTINDGTEETKSSWPPGYTEYVSNIKRNNKAQGGLNAIAQGDQWNPHAQ